MSDARTRRLLPVRLGILAFGILIIALLAASVGVPAQAKTGGGNVTLTLTCTSSSCSGSWFWREGGISGTLLGSGSIAGTANSTTVETTTQPATADTLNFGVRTSDCGQGLIEYITPGSSVNFTATVPKTDSDRDQFCSGPGSTFTIKS
jgi:hypothetical protein